jgi:hypothetical protein
VRFPFYDGEIVEKFYGGQNALKADFINSIGLGRLINFKGLLPRGNRQPQTPSGSGFLRAQRRKADGILYRKRFQSGAALAVVSEQWASANRPPLRSGLCPI